MQTIQDRLKAVRESYGLSQQELGLQLGMSQPAYAKYEDETKPPYTVLGEFINRFPVSPKWLLSDVKEPIDMDIFRARLESSKKSTAEIAAILGVPLRFLEAVAEEKIVATQEWYKKYGSIVFWNPYENKDVEKSEAAPTGDFVTKAEHQALRNEVEQGKGKVDQLLALYNGVMEQLVLLKARLRQLEKNGDNE